MFQTIAPQAGDISGNGELLGMREGLVEDPQGIESMFWKVSQGPSLFVFSPHVSWS